MAKRIIFSGSRHWTNPTPIESRLKTLLAVHPDAVVVHGGARGLDSMVGSIATQLGLAVEIHRADWSKWGRAAGPKRNQLMVDLGADHAFAYPLDGSKGTWDFVRKAKMAGIPVDVYQQQLTEVIK